MAHGFRLTFLAPLLALALVAGVDPAGAQCVSLTTLGAAATQNFDTLSSTAGSTTNNLTITGWFLTESGGGARDNEQYAVDTGGSGKRRHLQLRRRGRRRARARRPAERYPRPGDRRLLHQQHRCDDRIARRRLHRRAVAPRQHGGRARRSDRLPVQHQRDQPDDRHLDRRRRARLRHPDQDRGRCRRAQRQRRRQPVRHQQQRRRPVDRQRRDLLDPLDRPERHRRRRRPGGRRLLADPERRASGDQPLDQRRLPRRGRRGHDDLRLHGQPQRAGGAGRRDVRHRDRRRHRPGRHPATRQRLRRADADRPDDPRRQLDLHLHVTVNGDTTVEPNETFFVNVTNVTGATVTDGQGQGTITNDDVALTPIHDIQGPGAQLAARRQRR